MILKTKFMQSMPKHSPNNICEILWFLLIRIAPAISRQLIMIVLTVSKRVIPWRVERIIKSVTAMTITATWTTVIGNLYPIKAYPANTAKIINKSIQISLSDCPDIKFTIVIANPTITRIICMNSTNPCFFPFKPYFSLISELFIHFLSKWVFL